MKKFIAAGVASASLLAGCSGGGEKMPEVMQERFEQIDNESVPGFASLTDEDYSVYSETEMGGEPAYFATLGDVDEDTRVPAELFQEAFEFFYTLPVKDGETTVPAFSINGGEDKEFVISIRPRQGERYVISADGAIERPEFGWLYDAAPGFTNYTHEPIVTVLSNLPDGSTNPEALFVEACQTAIDFSVENEQELGIEPTSGDNMAQEVLCNTLGKAATAAVFFGVAYEEYETVESDTANGYYPAFGPNEDSELFTTIGIVSQDVYDDMLQKRAFSLDGQITHFPDTYRE